MGLCVGSVWTRISDSGSGSDFGLSSKPHLPMQPTHVHKDHRTTNWAFPSTDYVISVAVLRCSAFIDIGIRNSNVYKYICN